MDVEHQIGPSNLAEGKEATLAPTSEPVNLTTSTVISNKPYFDITVRYEGPEAKHIAGTFIDPSLDTGFRYKLYYGDAVGSTEERRPVFNQDPVVTLTQLRPCNVPGSVSVFKVKGHEHIYADNASHTHGFVFFEHALSVGETFSLVQGGSRVGDVIVTKASLSQPSNGKSAPHEQFYITPEASVRFEMEPTIIYGQRVEMTQSKYMLKRHAVELTLKISEELRAKLHLEKSLLSFTAEVVTSNRTASAISIRPLSWANDSRGQIDELLTKSIFLAKHDGLNQQVRGDLSGEHQFRYFYNPR